MKLEITWIGGKCPVQAEGKINDHPFYFRARGSRWAFAVDPDGDPSGILMGVKDGFCRREDFGKFPEAGHMPIDVSCQIIEQCAREYLSSIVQ